MQVYGIDLSKEKFDVSFIDAKGKEKNREVKNAVVSISRFLAFNACTPSQVQVRNNSEDEKYSNFPGNNSSLILIKPQNRFKAIRY